MPRRPLRVVVDLKIHAVTAPGVWLSSKEDVYLSINLFGQQRSTRLVRPMFPLLIHDHFRFEKTYYTAMDPSDVANFLEEEPAILELIQMSEYSTGAVRLAQFSTDARDFLYPYPSLAPSYSPTEREVLMDRTVHFPGISPKVEFSSEASIIRGSYERGFDDLEDALKEQKAALKEIKRDLRRCRSPSPSLRQHFDDLDLDSDLKPPFIVKRLDTNLIARKPGSPAPKSFLSDVYGDQRRTIRPRSRSLTRRRHSDVVCPRLCERCHLPFTERDCTVCTLYRKHVGQRYWGHSHCRHNRQVVREPYQSPRPIYGSKLVTSDSEDEEVAELLSSRALYPTRPRPRSVSPVLYRRSFQDRFSDRSSPRLSERIADRVDTALSRSRSLEKLNRDIARSRSPSPRYRRPYSTYDPTLDELEVDFAVARNRSLVHLDSGHYWTQKAAQYRGKPHRQIFNDNLSRLYAKLYGSAQAKSVR